METVAGGTCVCVCVLYQWGRTYSSVVSFFRPSHSFSFLWRTPFWVSHLTHKQSGGQRGPVSRVHACVRVDLT